MRKLILTAAVTAILGMTAGAFQLKTPADWKWRTDAPVTVTEKGGTLPADQWYYVGMPPGWHITTNPGVLLYHPAHAGTGNFTLQSEIFLFPGNNQEEYGLFLGGRSLEPASAEPAYIAFVARRDGRAAVLRRVGANTTVLVDWKENAAVLPQSGEEAKKNLLKVEVGPTELVFSANGTEIARIPRTADMADGAVGFRVGKSLNLHVSTFDLTHRLAPIPVKK
jgi:hypothetical protein